MESELPTLIPFEACGLNCSRILGPVLVGPRRFKYANPPAIMALSFRVEDIVICPSRPNPQEPRESAPIGERLRDFLLLHQT